MWSRLSERIGRAFRRSRFGIATIALTYVISVLAGLGLVHSGNRFALSYRDRLVGRAVQESSILRNLEKGNRLRAASLDAAGNTFAGAMSLVAGYFPPTGYGMAAFRGWIGGIVSVDDEHHSRLGSPKECLYFLTTLILQLIPYSLVGGAGVNLGIATFSRWGRSVYPGERMRWLLIPYEALGDAGWIFLVAVPLFGIASGFEFLAR
jgi:hypothetical protein